MGVLYARVAGAWVPVVASGGGNNEVYVGTDDPIVTYPDTEVWYDSDAPTADIDPIRQWNAAWGVVASTASSDIAISADPPTQTTVRTLTTAVLLPSRQYRAEVRQLSTYTTGSTAGHSFQLYVTLDGAAVGNTAYSVDVNGNYLSPGITAWDFTVATGGSHTVELKANRNTPSAGTMQARFFLHLVDLGPVSGAVPAPNPIPAWTPITFIDANWRSLNASSMWQTGYRKVGDRVELRGLVQRLNTAAAGNVSIAQMPVGFYVSGREMYFTAVRSADNTTGVVYVSASGMLSINAGSPFVALPSAAWISLDGISYSVTP